MRTRSAGGAGSAAALTAVLALTGCGGGEVGGQGPASPSTVTTSASSMMPLGPSPSPITSPEVSSKTSASSNATPIPESDRIITQYRAFFAGITPVWMTPDAAARAAEMAKLAVDPEYTTLLSAMKASRDAGEVGYGDDIVHPQLQSVTHGEATLVDCQDTSRHGRMKMATGKKVTQGRKNDLAQVTMKRGDDGLWRVATVAYAAAGSCHANG